MVEINRSNKHVYSITEEFKVSYHIIYTEKYRIPIIVPIINSDVDGVFVKELWLDITSGREFRDDKGRTHKIDVLNVKERPAPIREEEDEYKNVHIYYDNVICTDVGVMYYKDTRKPVKMSDSNGILRYKETNIVKGNKKGVSVKPYELCLEAFKDDPEAIDRIKSIWYPDGEQLKFVLISPAKMDSKRAKVHPIICEETGECFFNPRQYAFAITGIPNRTKAYPKNLVINKHQYRYANDDEKKDIYESYFKYRDNAPDEISQFRCVYARNGVKGEVLTRRDSLINFEIRNN